jgi:hypothetical protein
VTFVAAMLTTRLESTLQPELAMVDRVARVADNPAGPKRISGSFLLAFAGVIFQGVPKALLERRWRFKTQNGVSL